MRFTPTRPSRTKRELRRDGISDPDHVSPGNPILQAALFVIKADPQKAEEQRCDTSEVTGTARHASRWGRRIAVDVDDFHLEYAHAERAAERDVKDEQVGQRD